MSLVNKKKKSFLKVVSSVAVAAVVLSPLASFNASAAKSDVAKKSTYVAKSTQAVSTFEELKAALTNPNVTQIVLNNNITLKSTIYAVGTEKTIRGEEYTIDFKGIYNIKLNTLGAKGLMEKVNFKDTDVYGAFWSDHKGVETTYKDVNHSGKKIVYLPFGTLRISGAFSSDVTYGEGFYGNKLTIEPKAKVGINSSSPAYYSAPVRMIYPDSKLTVGSGAKLKINSPAINIFGDAHSSIVNSGEIELNGKLYQNIRLDGDGAIQLNSGSKLKTANQGPTYESILATGGSMYVNKGAKLEAESNGVHGTILTGANFNLQPGSEFSITNKNNAGAALGSYPGKTHVRIDSAQGLKTWARGTVRFSPNEPTFNFDSPVKASFKLSGYLNSTVQSEFVTNNVQFEELFNAKNVGKIESNVVSNPSGK